MFPTCQGPCNLCAYRDTILVVRERGVREEKREEKKKKTALLARKPLVSNYSSAWNFLWDAEQSCLGGLSFLRCVKHDLDECVSALSSPAGHPDTYLHNLGWGGGALCICVQGVGQGVKIQTSKKAVLESKPLSIFNQLETKVWDYAESKTD